MTGRAWPGWVSNTVSNVWKFSLMIVVAGLSGLVSAQAVVTIAARAPVFRAASAEAAVSDTNAEAGQGGRATIRKSSDGHYWANGQVGGASVRFLVDTGATAVALTPDDARRLGFDVGALNYANR